MALVQSFEICFELSWKVLKDYFYEGGRVLNSPREIIKQAINDEILQDGNEWLNALKSRNMTAHLYDEEVIETIIEDISSSYSNIFHDFYEYFKLRI